MDSIAGHLAYLEAAFEEARAAPLSRRKATLVAMLIDAYADRLFAAQKEHGDVLAFRAELAAGSPALALTFSVCAPDTSGPHLVSEAVDVPLDEYGTLSVEDFMVSLYNGHTVQRVRIALPDGGRRDVHEVLAEAIADLRARSY